MMRKLYPIVGVLSLFITFMAHSQALESICRVNSIQGTCIEAKDGDTIHVEYSNLLFGDEVSFCPEQVKVGGVAQVILCADQSHYRH